MKHSVILQQLRQIIKKDFQNYALYRKLVKSILLYNRYGWQTIEDINNNLDDTVKYLAEKNYHLYDMSLEEKIYYTISHYTIVGDFQGLYGKDLINLLDLYLHKFIKLTYI